MEADPIVIVSSARTPMGAMLGAFTEVPAWELGATAIHAVCGRAPLPHASVDSVIMGCVLQAGQGQAPARQAALTADIPQSAPCLTINKMCGSGLMAVILAHDLLLTDAYQTIVAGGFENMTRAPYLLTQGRTGYRLGNQEIYDHMFLDGLTDAYEKKLMGEYADATAHKFGLTRAMQDEFAIESLRRAKEAQAKGYFDHEIVPVVVKGKKETKIIEKDETFNKHDPNKIPTLKPAFGAQGTVTAANSSSIADGAAAHLLMRESQAKALGLRPLARIVGHATFAQDPAWFTTAPIYAIENLLKKISWTKDQVDLFEINEAFAVVTMAAIKELKLDPKKVNVFGGACTLGHPIGASGARILCTLLYALQELQLKRGVASLCIGGGEAVALAVERIES